MTTTETKQTITVLRNGNFTMHSLAAGVYVIEYFSSYKAAKRAKIFKTHKAAHDTWAKIESGKIDYVNF